MGSKKVDAKSYIRTGSGSDWVVELNDFIGENEFSCEARPSRTAPGSDAACSPPFVQSGTGLTNTTGGSVLSSTLCVIFAFLALFAVNCFKGVFTAKYAKSRKDAQRNSSN